jgi:hypothetical protein
VWVEVLALTALLLPGLIALLASAWLIQVAVATTPLPPLRKRTTAKVIAGFALLLVVPAAYGVTHPLAHGSVYGSGSSREVTFALANHGFADVRVTAVSVSDLFSAFPVARLAGPAVPFTVDARAERRVRLTVSQGGCSDGGPMRANALVRYRLLGSELSARIPVEVTLRPCGPG